MMDWTDTHCRVLHRLLTRRALLYTEMVTADAVLHGDRLKLLGFDACEHPVAVQLGGSEPAALLLVNVQLKLGTSSDFAPDRLRTSAFQVITGRVQTADICL